ncbi:hypothetical protein AHAS_Ahas04G0121300 [Arachis hypogaea]
MDVFMGERADLVFHNKIISEIAIKRIIIKILGFRQATITSISLRVNDLLTISSKGWLV